MRKYFKQLLYLVALVGFSLSHGGSYEDFFSAIKQDNPSAINALLNRGFDPNTLSPQGQDGLYVAVNEGAIKAAQALIQWPRTKVESRTPKDESPLMMAALRGHIEIARKLIARDADVNKTGWTPLHYAATGGHVAIIELLLEYHAYIDAESPNGTTPLMMAAQYGTQAAVKLLLDSGADPGLKNQLGMTAIDFARRTNRDEAADLIARTVRAGQQKGKW